MENENNRVYIERVSITIDPDTLGKLNKLEDIYDRNRSDTIRQLINEAYERQMELVKK